MEFEWKQLDVNTLILSDYEKSLIAKVEWVDSVGIWKLSSEWLNYSSDIDVSIGKYDIKELKLVVLERINEACGEFIERHKDLMDLIDVL